MSCQKVQKLILPLLDQTLTENQRTDVLQHMAFCRECSARVEAAEESHIALRTLNVRPVPVRLSAQLRVLASHERQRRMAHASVSSLVGHWWMRLELLAENLMRPLALPFAGGLLSALVMFSMLVPTLNFRHNFRDDVPIVGGTYTDAGLSELSPFCNNSIDHETVIELTIDEKGQISNWRVSEGQMTQDLANDLLFSKFRPATLFGRPTPGKFYLTFRRSRTIVVRG